MRLSTKTFKILKNFSEINPTILIRSGSNIVTIDHNKRIIADANLEDSIPQDFAIHDLNQFLTVSSLFENPEYTFKKDRVVVTQNNRQVNYIFADPSCVTDAKTARDRLPNIFKEEDIVQKFSISEEDLKSLKQTSAILKYPHITFVGDSAGVRIVASDINNDSAGDFVVNLAPKADTSFQYTMLLDNLRVLPGNYNIAVSPNIAHFTNMDFPIKYWIVMEAV